MPCTGVTLYWSFFLLDALHRCHVISVLLPPRCLAQVSRYIVFLLLPSNALNQQTSLHFSLYSDLVNATFKDIAPFRPWLSLYMRPFYHTNTKLTEMCRGFKSTNYFNMLLIRTSRIAFVLITFLDSNCLTPF